MSLFLDIFQTVLLIGIFIIVMCINYKLKETVKLIVGIVEALQIVVRGLVKK